MPSSYEMFDNSVGTSWDAGLGVQHALNGNFSPGGDTLDNFIDVSNVPRDVGPVGADMGFFTTDIPGTLFAVDANAIAWAFALKGVSYMIGNLVGLLDDFGVFKDIKRDFNVFYGSSSPDS